MNEENGVTIGFREIYDQLQITNKSLDRMEARMEQMEEQTRAIGQMDERSRQAAEKADKAYDVAIELKKKIEKEEQDRKDTRSRFYVSVASRLAPYVLFVIGLIFYLIKGGS